MKIIRMRDGQAFQIITEAIDREGQILVIYQQLTEPFSVFALEKQEFQEWMDVDAPENSVESVESMGTRSNVPVPHKPKEERRSEASLIEEFLDAEMYSKKMEILEKYEDKISEETMELLALTMDAALEGNTRENRYYSLMQVLRTRARFEIDR